MQSWGSDDYEFQSTLPARGATGVTGLNRPQFVISIHAPRTGSDFPLVVVDRMLADFNPRSPHGERPRLHHAPHPRMYFNPRSPHGERPENWRFSRVVIMKFQSTLPARGATAHLFFLLFFGIISIHAPRTGSDASMSSCRWRSAISIHAPRTGSDDAFAVFIMRHIISIHAPRTGSDVWLLPSSHSLFAFQSTLPARGATSAMFCRIPLP